MVFQLALYQSLGSEVTPWSGGGLVAMQIPTQIFAWKPKIQSRRLLVYKYILRVVTKVILVVRKKKNQVLNTPIHVTLKKKKKPLCSTSYIFGGVGSATRLKLHTYIVVDKQTNRNNSPRAAQTLHAIKLFYFIHLFR